VQKTKTTAREQNRSRENLRCKKNQRHPKRIQAETQQISFMGARNDENKAGARNDENDLQNRFGSQFLTVKIKSRKGN
jgi:hypothetical protein